MNARHSCLFLFISASLVMAELSSSSEIPSSSSELPLLSSSAAQSSSSEWPSSSEMLSFSVVAVSSSSESSIVQVAGTTLSGNVSGFLTEAKSPYIVLSTIVVPQGKALVIGAGVRLEFMPGTGLDVRGGSLAIAGSENAPVVMLSAKNGSFWNGVTITGSKRADLQGLNVSGAVTGIAVENGGADIRNAVFDGMLQYGVYARSSAVSLEKVNVSHVAGIGLDCSADAVVNIENSKFEENHVAISAGKKSDVKMSSVSISRNDYGFVNKGGNGVRVRNSQIVQNGYGLVSSENPLQDIKSAVARNKVDFSSKVQQASAGLSEEPANPYAGKFGGVSAVSAIAAQGDSSWTTLSGNLSVELGYHFVYMRHNHSGEPWMSGRDTVAAGDRYVNYFQTPGTFANWNIYMLMQSSDGRSIDFSADLSSNSWNRFDAHSVQTTYMDARQKLSLGDVYLTGGDIYLAGIDVLGASYSLNLFENSRNVPLFILSGFGGESRAPKYEGKKNYAIYKDYVDDGEAESQEMVAGGSLRWNPVKRFNATVGIIGSKDYLKDPFFRDGMSGETNTIDPMLNSKTIFAEGNWLVYPGDIELNGQIAVGAADTADVLLQRAINKVFGDAGLDVSDAALLRSLMRNPSLVQTLTSEDLEEIFGDNTLLSAAEQRAELRGLLDEAKNVQKQYARSEDTPSDVQDWSNHNLAISASLRWDLGKTIIAGHVSYIGQDYYSAGSPDQLNNTRGVGGSIDRKLTSFWDLSLAYDLRIENASTEGSENVFGFGEGTKWGLFPDSSAAWFREHEQDESRAHYIHDANIGNVFKVGSLAEISLNYAADYRARSRPIRLYANYSTGEAGVYSDAWFAAKNGSRSIGIISEDDTLYVDSARFAEYYALAGEPYIASQFMERILKHTVSAEVSLKFSKNVLKLGGIWTYRRDLSYFENDSIMERFDFSDETFGTLGYYFHGADYFEQRYPVSLTLTFNEFRNRLAFVPRYKAYNRADMREYEGNVSEHIEFPLLKNLLDVSLDGSARYEISRKVEDGESVRESEADIDGAATLRVHYTGELYSDVTLGAYYNYRPDYTADEYKDFFGSVSLSYAF